MSRITQRDIARLAGVSQATVSQVLNNRHDSTTRLSPETRQRVLAVIRETGYAANPAARQLVRRRNEILGVFTYEPVFPSGSADFYHPFLIGIEDRAEQLGCDLLLFTSAPVTGGTRRIFHENNRLRIADGCLLLGREIPGEELAQLIRTEYPFVAIGRRDDAGGPVPYVGADYATATRALVGRAKHAGHRAMAYVGAGEGAESAVDRMRGFLDATNGEGLHVPIEGRDVAATLTTLRASGVTAAFMEDIADGIALVAEARARGLKVPDDMSVIALGDPTRPVQTDLEFTGFRIPRRQMGQQAVDVLADRLEDEAAEGQRLLPCELVEGQTLGTPRKDTK
ncbi:LacI family DNA-binding transcriptional regulator [Streptomyces sp. NPDC005318]|uniref:LacI family DNA-binding transcriptional regulator n=1 Tax=Streptomyces sp. NPDC005318 TaxID=3157031 RepID=UPI0033A91338